MYSKNTDLSSVVKNVLDKYRATRYNVRMAYKSKEGEHMTISTTKIEILTAEQGLTNAALAAKCGISRQSVSTILRRGSCSPVNAGKLARGLGVPVTDIIREEE